jgi:hypothetical protein
MDQPMEITRRATAALEHRCGAFTLTATWCGGGEAEGVGRWDATKAKEPGATLMGVTHCPNCGNILPTGIAVKFSYLHDLENYSRESSWAEIKESAPPKPTVPA